MKEARSSTANKVGLAFSYWFMAIVRPGRVFRALKSDPDKSTISLWIIFLFSFMYAITAYLLYRVGMLPAIEPWIPISKEKYYFYQTFWTIPWGLAAAIMMGGVAHVIATIGRQDTYRYLFEDALLVNVVSWVIPSFVFMWLPETFVVAVLRDIPWPDWAEILRLGVFPVIWQIGLVIIGMRITHRISWPRGIIVGIVVTSLGFLMFLPIMR